MANNISFNYDENSIMQLVQNEPNGSISVILRGGEGQPSEANEVISAEEMRDLIILYRASKQQGYKVSSIPLPQTKTSEGWNPEDYK